MLAQVTTGDTLGAVIALGIFLLGGLVNTVWLLASIKSRVGDLQADQVEHRGEDKAVAIKVQELMVRVARLETKRDRNS
jgi:hypothetical protein